MRLSGTLRSWNDDRGFGFIAPTHGGAELFVHISSLPRDGSRPTVGEKLTYELGRGKNGQPQAVGVQRQAIGRTSERSRSSKPASAPSRPLFAKVIGLVLVLVLSAVGYDRFQTRTTAHPRSLQPLTTTPEQGFKCDGRTHCSQMTSCTEAKYFLRNCPGTQMDGNRDGTPCEQQWCTSTFAK